MARPFRRQIDEGIVDRAAALFARRGFAKTSVQEIADAVGLSKAGLLHHFPSKDALWNAVVAQADALGQQVFGPVHELPAGPERDRRVLEVLVDVALAHPEALGNLTLTSASGKGSERIIGFLIYWLVHDEVHILNVAVGPEHRRKGVARMLMAETERRAQQPQSASAPSTGASRRRASTGRR